MMSFRPEKTFTLKDIGRPPTAAAKAAEAAALSAAGAQEEIEIEPPRIVMHEHNELEPVPAELVARKLLDTAKQVETELLEEVYPSLMQQHQDKHVFSPLTNAVRTANQMKLIEHERLQVEALTDRILKKAGLSAGGGRARRGNIQQSSQVSAAVQLRQLVRSDDAAVTPRTLSALFPQHRDDIELAAGIDATMHDNLKADKYGLNQMASLVAATGDMIHRQSAMSLQVNKNQSPKKATSRPTSAQSNRPSTANARAMAEKQAAAAKARKKALQQHMAPDLVTRLKYKLPFVEAVSDTLAAMDREAEKARARMRQRQSSRPSGSLVPPMMRTVSISPAATGGLPALLPALVPALQPLPTLQPVLQSEVVEVSSPVFETPAAARSPIPRKTGYSPPPPDPAVDDILKRDDDVGVSGEPPPRLDLGETTARLIDEAIELTKASELAIQHGAAFSVFGDLPEKTGSILETQPKSEPWPAIQQRPLNDLKRAAIKAASIREAEGRIQRGECTFPRSPSAGWINASHLQPLPTDDSNQNSTTPGTPNANDYFHSFADRMQTLSVNSDSESEAAQSTTRSNRSTTSLTPVPALTPSASSKLLSRFHEHRELPKKSMNISRSTSALQRIAALDSDFQIEPLFTPTKTTSSTRSLRSADGLIDTHAAASLASAAKFLGQRSPAPVRTPGSSYDQTNRFKLHTGDGGGTKESRMWDARAAAKEAANPRPKPWQTTSTSSLLNTRQLSETSDADSDQLSQSQTSMVRSHSRIELHRVADELVRENKAAAERETKQVLARARELKRGVVYHNKPDASSAINDKSVSELALQTIQAQAQSAEQRTAGEATLTRMNQFMKW